MKRAWCPALLAVVLTGCISFSTFQTPRVLEPGAGTVGAGATVVAGAGDDIGVLPEIYGRYGLGERVDAGAKVSGVPPFGLVFGDVKYQLVDGPFAVALDLGVSYAGGSVTTNDEEEEDFDFVGLYPAIMAGTDRLYGGAKAIYIAAGTADTDWVSGDVFGLFAGTSIGDDVRFLPEVHVYFGDDGADVLGGVALQLTVGGE